MNKNSVFKTEEFITDNIPLGQPVDTDKLTKDNVLIRYPGKAKYLTIPRYINVIGGYAISNNYTIKTLTVTESVTEILPHAFENCIELEEVVILGNNLRYIGKSAFKGCVKLKKINIPDSVTNLDSGAFARCQSLETAVLSESLTCSEDNIA